MTESDLAEVVADINGRFTTMAASPFSVATTETVESMFDRELLLQEGRRLKISPPEEELHRQVEEMVREIRSNFTSEKLFYQTLAEEGISLSQLKEELLKKSKVDYTVYNVVDAQYSVSDSDVEGYSAKQSAAGEAVQSYRLRRLGIPINESVGAQEACQRAQGLVAQIITEGISFEEGVRRFSQVPGAAADGGDMGYMASDKLSAEVRAAIQDLDNGQASAPVIAGGYANIFYVQGKRGARSALREEKFFEAKTELLAKLRRKLILQVFDQRLAGIMPENYKSALIGSAVAVPMPTQPKQPATLLLGAPTETVGTPLAAPAPTQYQPTPVAPSPTPKQRQFPRWFGNRQ